jgi:hypothetical protein
MFGLQDQKTQQKQKGRWPYCKQCLFVVCCRSLLVARVLPFYFFYCCLLPFAVATRRPQKETANTGKKRDIHSFNMRAAPPPHQPPIVKGGYLGEGESGKEDARRLHSLRNLHPREKTNGGHRELFLAMPRQLGAEEFVLTHRAGWSPHRVSPPQREGPHRIALFFGGLRCWESQRPEHGNDTPGASSRLGVMNPFQRNLTSCLLADEPWNIQRLPLDMGQSNLDVLVGHQF